MVLGFGSGTEKVFFKEARYKRKEEVLFALNRDYASSLITSFSFYGVRVNDCQFHHL